MHIAIVAPLPPARSGVAAFAAEQIFWLAKNHKVTAYVTEASDVIPIAGCELARIEELDDTDADIVLYHLGNSVQNLPQVQAAISGPPGVVELHDGSLHHLVEAVTLGLDDTNAYKDALSTAHGEAGASLADVRAKGSRGNSELALFDLLAPVLAEHHHVIVHSRWAHLQVRRRAARVASTVVPLHAPKPHPRLPREQLGLKDGDPLITHAGFLTSAKRPELMVKALRLVRERLPNAKLVLLGSDQSRGRLSAAINRHDQSDAVICTGYLSDAELHGYLAAMDVALALRSPHVGESSAPIAAAFSAGLPVVTQAIGAWAELPQNAVSFAPIGEDEPAELARSLIEILTNPAKRSRMGEAARKIAQTTWEPRRCAELVANVLKSAEAVTYTSPDWIPETVAGNSAVVVAAPEAATELRIAGWQVASRSTNDLDTVAAGTADLLIWGDSDATMQSLAQANRCLDSLGSFMWLNAPKRAGDALHRAGLTDGAGGVATAADGGRLVAQKTRLPAAT